MRKNLAFVLAASVLFAPAVGMAETKISFDQALKDCKADGNGLVPGVAPVLSDLKKEASLVGMAYLNYIYQNDIRNKHFCESMLLMSSQVPAGTRNPYVDLFTRRAARKTVAALDAVQMCFDYAIGRTNAPEATVKAAVERVRKNPK